jgi:hypothetical protein
VIAGTVMVFGPGFLIPATVAGVAVVELSDIKHRTLTNDEIDFVKRVFLGELPYSSIYLTNLSRGAHAYTIPSIDGSILANVNGAYDNPTESTQSPNYEIKGQLLIHELTHAWQIHHTNFLPEMLIDGGTYDYRSNPFWASQPWSEFNLEQQASIVDDWFGTFATDLNSTAAINDPAFKYISHNIRLGRL